MRPSPYGAIQREAQSTNASRQPQRHCPFEWSLPRILDTITPNYTGNGTPISDDIHLEATPSISGPIHRYCTWGSLLRTDSYVQIEDPRLHPELMSAGSQTVARAQV